MSEDLRAFNVRLPKELHEYTKLQAEKRGLTMNAIIIFALENYYTQMQVLPHLEDLIKFSKENDAFMTEE